MKKYLLVTLLFVIPLTTNATDFLSHSEFDNAQAEIQFSLLHNQILDEKYQATESDGITYNAGNSSSNKDATYKSPGKAFAMSLLIPGWGQHYNGSSKIKSLAFLGTEITSWVFYFKLHGDAESLTDDFEQFNRDHWIESRYDSLLLWTYPNRDANPGLYPEMSHHLPDDPNDQQYFEMTGKYNQFSWGWDDAILLSDNSVFSDYNANNPFPRVNVSEQVPFSANRNAYEIMRDDANNKFSQARKMIYVSMLNRIISGFEAMITAKKNNKNSNSGFSSVSAEASFKSLYVKRDTPYITLSMKF